jgi:peptidoglycan/LPS O-acetylase OafA/YrhL
MSDDSKNPYGVGASIASVYEADVPIVLRPVIRRIGWIHCILIAVAGLLFAGLAMLYVWDNSWEAAIFLGLSLPFFAAANGMQKHVKQPLRKKERSHAGLMLAGVCIPLFAVCPILAVEFVQHGRLSGPLANPVWIGFVVPITVSAVVRWNARNSHQTGSAAEESS